MNTPWNKVLPLSFLLTTPAWACGTGLGSLVLVALAFFGLEAFFGSLIAGVATQCLLKPKLAFPKLTLMTATTLGSVAGFVGFLVTSSSGDVNATVGATGVISSLVAVAITACAPRARVTLVDEVSATPAPPAASVYDTAQEWKSL